MKRIASTPRLCTTERQRVVVVLDTRTVLSWDLVTNKLTEVAIGVVLDEISNLTTSTEGSHGIWTHLAVLVQPAASMALTFLSVFRSSQSTSVWLYEIRDKAVHPRSHQKLPISTRHAQIPGTVLPSAAASKSDSFGTYQIALDWHDAPMLQELFKYNIYTSSLETVTTNHHYDINSCLLWNNRLYHVRPTWQDTTERPSRPSSPHGVSHEVLLCRHDTMLGAVDNAHCHVMSSSMAVPRERFPRDFRRPSTRSQEIFGDDQFLVQCTPKGWLSIWRFQ